MNHLIVDGLSLAYRSHHAFGTLTAGSGMQSGCVWGFLTGLRARKKRHPDCHVTVAWDSSSAAKKAIFPAYKADRPSIPAVHSQVADLKAMLVHAGVDQAWAPGQEADDVIATLVDLLGKDGLVYILTSDKDLMQLVRDGKVIMIRPKTANRPETYYDEEAVAKDYGVPPAGIASYLALRGDTVDGIPGLSRVRSAVIAGMVNRHGDPEAVYAKVASETLTEFERAAFDGFRDQARINYRLTRLDSTLALALTGGKAEPEMLQPYLDKYGIRKIEAKAYVDAFARVDTFHNRTSVAMALPSLFE